MLAAEARGHSLGAGMSKLAEILSSGIAPGFAQGAKDPQCAEVAVPRAFRELEQTTPASEIERQSGFKAAKIKRAWDFKQKL